MRFGIFGLLAALAVGMITVTGDVSTADAQACRKNYYRCDLNTLADRLGVAGDVGALALGFTSRYLLVDLR